MTRAIKESAGGTERGESRLVALLYTRLYSAVCATRVHLHVSCAICLADQISTLTNLSFADTRRLLCRH